MHTRLGWAHGVGKHQCQPHLRAHRQRGQGWPQQTVARAILLSTVRIRPRLAEKHAVPHVCPRTRVFHDLQVVRRLIGPPNGQLALGLSVNSG